MTDPTDHRDPIHVETEVPASSVEPGDASEAALPGALRRRLQTYYGSRAEGVTFLSGTTPRALLAPAFTSGRRVFLDSSLLALGEEALGAILAHELAHAVQQGAPRRKEGETRGSVTVLESRSLEAEADEAARRFLAGAATPPPLTILSPHGPAPLLQCQQYGQVGQHTLDQPRNWAAPQALGGAVNVEYSAVHSRNEVYNGRAGALSRAKLLAGVSRQASRTYHFTAGAVNNEGAKVQGQAPGGMNGPAREGRYYDFGGGPRGRLVIVEHVADANALVTIAHVAHAPTAHFHVCTYGQHVGAGDAYAHWAKPNDGRNWQAFDPTTMFMPFFSSPGVQGFATNLQIRAYELDGRFGEVGGNEHHVYYV